MPRSLVCVGWVGNSEGRFSHIAAHIDHAVFRHTLQNKHQFPALPVLRALLDYNYTRDWGTALKHMDAMLTDKERIKQKIWLEMKETEEKSEKAMIS